MSTKATTDRRVERTRRTLRAALMELIAERGYEGLSVQDIVERADVGRATFYLHYPDRERLLVDCIEQVAVELSARLGGLEGASIEARALELTRALFTHVGEQAGFYRVLLGERGVALLGVRVRQLTAATIEAELRAAFAPPPGREPPYAALAQHTAGALLALLAWWLETGAPASPDELAALHWRLAAPGVAAVLSPAAPHPGGP